MGGRGGQANKVLSQLCFIEIPFGGRGGEAKSCHVCLFVESFGGGEDVRQNMLFLRHSKQGCKESSERDSVQQSNS